jgi:hypothetical protein
MRFSVRSLAVPVVTASVGLATLALSETDARADYYAVRRAPESAVALNLGLDLEGASDVTPPARTSSEGGGGLKLRIGAEIRRPYLRIIPEGGFSYTHLFVNDSAGNNEGWNLERLFVGVRIGFGEVVVPVIYGHIGYGWRATGQDNNSGGFGFGPNTNGFTADGGVGLDFHLVRHFGFGFHAEYVTLQASPSVPDWLAFGAHADYRF